MAAVGCSSARVACSTGMMPLVANGSINWGHFVCGPYIDSAVCPVFRCDKMLYLYDASMVKQSHVEFDMFEWLKAARAYCASVWCSVSATSCLGVGVPLIWCV